MLKLKNFVLLLLLFVSIPSFADWKLSPSQYKSIESDLIAFESVRYCPYVGLNGVMTIGIGQTIADSKKLISKTGREYNQITLWSLKKINNMFKKAGVHQMNKSQYQQIANLNKKTNAILSNPNFDYKRDNKKYYKKQPRSNVYCLSKTDNNVELLKLLKYSIDVHTNSMAKNAKARDIDLSQMPDEVIEFIFDLFYRGGPGLVLGPDTKVINKAIRERDILSIFKEGFARSNAKKNKQNDIRNAYYTALGMKLLSTGDKLRFKTFLKSNKAAQLASERINDVVEKSPQSIPPHAEKPVIELALKRNVFINVN
jgi:hypothetical protein